MLVMREPETPGGFRPSMACRPVSNSVTADDMMAAAAIPARGTLDSREGETRWSNGGLHHAKEKKNKRVEEKLSLGSAERAGLIPVRVSLKSILVAFCSLCKSLCPCVLFASQAVGGLHTTWPNYGD